MTGNSDGTLVQGCDAAHAKSAKEDLTDAEKDEIRKLVAAIEAQA
jgi:hypothetical protein